MIIENTLRFPSRIIVLPLVSLAVTALLLSVWFTAISASDQNQPLTAENEPVWEDLQWQPPAFDLAIHKAAVPFAFTIGSNNWYVINVARVNTETITSSIAVEDVLPQGVIWLPQVVIGSWNCSCSTTTVVSCFYTEQVEPDQTELDPLIINVIVSENISTVITNTARLFANDANPDNDQSTVITQIRSADLEIQFDHTPFTVPSMYSVITFTATVTNNGITVAEHLFITETLPAELNPYNIVSLSHGTIDPATYLWTGFDLQPDEVATLVMTTTPKIYMFGRQISVTARVSSATHDWDLSNNDSTTSFVVGGLEIEKQVSTSHTLAGLPFEYTIAITNPSPASIGTLVRDQFPRTLEITDCYINSPQSKCSIADNTLTNFLSIPTLQTFRIFVTAYGNQDIVHFPREITNTASITWGIPSFTLNSNEVETVIEPAGSIQVGASDGLFAVSPGQLVTYTIFITNLGSLPILFGTLRVTDTFMSNLSFVKVNPNGLAIQQVYQTGNVYSWIFPDEELAPAEDISFSITARVSSNPVISRAENKIIAFGRDLIGRITTSGSTDLDDIPSVFDEFLFLPLVIQ